MKVVIVICLVSLSLVANAQFVARPQSGSAKAPNPGSTPVVKPAAQPAAQPAASKGSANSQRIGLNPSPSNSPAVAPTFNPSAPVYSRTSTAIAPGATQADPIHLRSADSLVVSSIDSQVVRELVGHVHLDHGNVSVYCDHATQYMATDLVILQGSVRIVQGSVTMLMPHGEYSGISGIASGSGGVTIIDRRMTLKAPEGIYNSRSNQADFHGGVEIQDDSIRILAKDLRYLRSTQESWLWGHVRLYSKVSPSCMVGDSAHNVPATSYSVLRGRPLLLHIDTVPNEALSQLRQAEREKAIQDSIVSAEKKLKNTGKKTKSGAEGSSKASSQIGTSTAKNSATKKSPSSNALPQKDLGKHDSLLASADSSKQGSTKNSLRFDTLTIVADVMQSFRAGGEDRYVASRNVEVLRKTLSARAGRCVFDKNAESIELRQEPQLWADSLQLSADSLWLHLPNKKLRSIEAYHSAFLLMVDSVDHERAHQIAAEHLHISIEEDTVRAIQAVREAKSLYFMSGDQGPDGLSRTVCDSLFIYFELGQLQNIVWRSGVNSEYYPENMVGDGARKYYLPTFHEAGPRPRKPKVEQRFNGTEPSSATESSMKDHEDAIDIEEPVQESEP